MYRLFRKKGRSNKTGIKKKDSGEKAESERPITNLKEKARKRLRKKEEIWNCGVCQKFLKEQYSV